MVPQHKGFFDELFDGAIDVTILDWMQVVDVTGELDAATGRELEIRRQPLILVGHESGFTAELARNFVPLAGPSVDGIANTHSFVLEEA